MGLTGVRRLVWRLRHRVRELLRGLGPSASLRRVMYVYDLDDRRPSVGSSTSVHFVELSPEELRARGEALGAGARMAHRGVSGETGCIVGLVEGAMVYHAWYVRADGRQMQGVPPTWTPRGRVLFLHDGYTEPGFRGQGIHTAATFWLLDRERGTDVAHAVCVVHADNVAAARAVERAGFRALARIH